MGTSLWSDLASGTDERQPRSLGSGRFVSGTAPVGDVCIRPLSPPTTVARGWIEGIPVPAALVTPTGQITAASPACATLFESSEDLVGHSLLDLLMPEDRERAAQLIAFPSPDAAAESVTLDGNRRTYGLQVGVPLEDDYAALRLVLLVPAAAPPHSSRSPSPFPRLPSSLPPQPAWGSRVASALGALEQLPFPALVVGDESIVAVTTSAADLLGVAPSALRGVSVASLVGTEQSAELCGGPGRLWPQWQPRQQAAFPVRVDGAVRAVARGLLPLAVGDLGLLMIEGWEPNRQDAPRATPSPPGSSYLLAGVAHELNNPLAFVIPTLDDLVREIRRRRDLLSQHPVEEWLDQLDEIQRGVTRIAGVVGNLRGAQEHVSSSEPTSLNQVVADTLRLASASLGLGIHLHRDLGAIAQVRAHRHKLGQILLNLVVNAIHAIAESDHATGNVFVRTWQDPQWAWIEVRDDGPGVPPEHQARIFEPFFTTRAEGSGLGLAVCRSLAREQGGELLLESPTGSGAVFRVRLPLWSSIRTGGDHSNLDAPPRHGPPSSCALEPSAKQAGVEPTRTPSGFLRPLARTTPSPGLPTVKARLLLVDDDPGVRRALARMLRQHHVVDQAGSVEEAFAMATRHSYDLLVTDLVMSHGGGAALIERLRSAGRALADRVVVVSGTAPNTIALPCQHVPKPCSREQLLVAVAQALESRTSPAAEPLATNERLGG